MRLVVIDGEEYERPTVRGDCLPGGCNEARPCPWVSCRWSLSVEVAENGEVTERDGNAASCALDVADDGEHTNEAIGDLTGVTREYIRQTIDNALQRLGDYAAEGDITPPSSLPDRNPRVCAKCGKRPTAMVRRTTRMDQRDWCYMCRHRAHRYRPAAATPHGTSSAEEYMRLRGVG